MVGYSNGMPETQPVSFPVHLQGGSAEHHVGLIVLSTDETIECAMHAMLPRDSGVMFYSSRVNAVNPVTIDNLRKMGPQLAHAASLILPDVPLDAIAFGCTSGTVALGYETVKHQILSGLPEDRRGSVEVITPLTAARDAFRAMGITNIALLTPYIDSVNQPIVGYFADKGIETVALKSLLVESDADVARVGPADIVRAARETIVRDADAVFISCTALRATDVLHDLERALDIPVLSSNQCMFWAMMKAAGHGEPIAGFGRLLREFL